ncbi:hypothetical protein D7X32_37555 [Corallococcus carmarthensis]|uniref:Uncharacterized protein n=2 Tax=Corallococcus carmarthensis TaxID=2316728 RepID=A0A3A8JJH0_9BACT|nr:hypothetical protein D7X32_37555 [Corallococcus carmarthensis]
MVGMTPEELERIQQLVAGVSYRDWKVISFIDPKGVARMQISAILPDSTTGKPFENYSIALPLCSEMSDGLILDLVFELIKEYEIHEAAERFSVAGKRLYFPHRPDGMPLFEVPSMRGALPTPVSAEGEGAGEGEARAHVPMAGRKSG